MAFLPQCLQYINYLKPAYFELAVTCHYINDDTKLSTAVLGVLKFPETHTQQRTLRGQEYLFQSWRIRHKFTCLITECSSNMTQCASLLQMWHIPCFAHILNLAVRKSLLKARSWMQIEARQCKLVSFFCSSTTATEKLSTIQQQMGRPRMKL